MAANGIQDLFLGPSERLDKLYISYLSGPSL